jgi:hypothetical protein
MVTVLAGAETHGIEVEEAALVKRSELFRTAWVVRRGDGMKQALMKLPEIDVRHFLLYEHWLYTSELDYAVLGYDDQKKIPDFANHLHRIPLTPNAEERVKTQSSILADSLVHLWAIGNLLQDRGIQKTAMAELRKWYVNERVPSVVSKQTIAFVDSVT